MPPFSTLHAIWLSFVCFIAGGINAIAGGGSLLSFPAILQTGVLPIQANATNTVALLPGQITSAAAYRGELRRYRSILPLLLVLAFAGGLIGARLLLATPQDLFLYLIPWLLLLSTLLFAFGPWLRRRGPHPPASTHATGLYPLTRLLLPVGVFIISLYVGFFGAGAGLLIMAVLSFAGIDSVHEINALKTILTSTSNTVAAVAFILSNAVVWHYGAWMMLSGSLGGYIIARVARNHKPRAIRYFVVAVGSLITAYFFFKLY